MNDKLSLEGVKDILPEDEEMREFGVIHIPIILFKEIFQSLGISDPREIHTRGGKYALVELNPDHRNTGFQGAIGLQFRRYNSSPPYAEFVLWERIPEGEPDSVFEPNYALSIVGRTSDAGVWAYRRGNLLKEEITANLRFSYGISLRSPAAKLIALIIYRAHLLTQDSSFQVFRFWEAEAWPGEEYAKP